MTKPPSEAEAGCTHGRGEGDVRIKTEIGVMHLQVKEYWQPPEPEEAKNGFRPGTSPCGPADLSVLVSSLQN